MGQNGSESDAGTRFAAVREVRAYWTALRDDQVLPRRAQINPRGMAGALHQVFMVERIAPGMARFRLAGNEVHDVMGMDVRGMPLSALFDPTARARLAEVLDKVMGTQTIFELDLEADRGFGRPELRARLLLMPLQGDAGEADLILGCLACDGQIGRAPRRFVIARALEHVIDAAAPAPTRKALPDLATRTAFAPPATPVLVAAAPHRPAPACVAALAERKRNHLRLVSVDD